MRVYSLSDGFIEEREESTQLWMVQVSINASQSEKGVSDAEKELMMISEMMSSVVSLERYGKL